MIETPQDPRLDALMQYTVSELSQAPTDDTVALRQRIADLERLVGILLRTPTIQVGSGAPTQASRDGTPYLDVTNSRLYVRSASVWKSTLLS